MKLPGPAWAMLEYGWYPLLLFALTPWFLHRLGAELYGHWMLLTATVGLGGVLTAGTGAATIKAVSAAIGNTAVGAMQRAVKGALALAISGGGVLASIVFIFFWVGGPSVLGRMGSSDLVQLTGVVAAALIWLEQIDNVFSSAIKGAEYFGDAARVEMLAKSTQVLGAALVLLISPELWSIYAILIITALLRLFAKVVVSRRLLGLLDLRPSFSEVRDILHFTKWGWVQGIGHVLFGVSDRLIIGSLLGASSLAYYSIAAQLAMQVHAFSAAGVSVLFPKVSRIVQRRPVTSVWRMARRSILGNFLLSSFLGLALFLAGPLILRLWIGNEAAAHAARLLPWLVLAYWILALNVVFYYLLLGMGRIRFIAVTVLASGIIGTVAVYIAISSVGLIGTAAGRIAYAVASLGLAFPLMVNLLREQHPEFHLPAGELPGGGGTGSDR